MTITKIDIQYAHYPDGDIPQHPCEYREAFICGLCDGSDACKRGCKRYYAHVNTMEADNQGQVGGEQSMPTKNALPYVWSLVIRDMVDRGIVGVKRYGTRLQPNNGRDSLRDALDEALDLACYLRQAIYERDGK